MARNGVVVSQQGIDISRAADYQKVLDSNWKFLDILEEIDVDISFNYNSGPTRMNLIPIYEHGLGYVTAFEFFPSKKSGGSAFNGDYTYAHKFIRGDDQKIYAEVFYSAVNPDYGAGRIVGKLRVFTLNILENYTAPSVYQFSTTEQPPSRYGAKFLNLQKGVSTVDDEDLSNYTLNTKGKQTSIHKHGMAQANESLTIVHDVGYPPSYLLCGVNEAKDYTDFQGGYPKYNSPQNVGGLVNSYYLAKADPTTIEFRGVQSTLGDRKFGYVILKDPAEIAG
jgi:hypothetical protein